GRSPAPSRSCRGCGYSTTVRECGSTPRSVGERPSWLRSVAMAENVFPRTASDAAFNFHISPPPGSGTTAERDAVIHRLADQYKDFLSAHQRTVTAVQEVRARRNASIINRVGETTWKKIREYSRTQRL